jgi:hypothetical protein
MNIYIYIRGRVAGAGGVPRSALSRHVFRPSVAAFLGIQTNEGWSGDTPPCRMAGVALHSVFSAVLFDEDMTL